MAYIGDETIKALGCVPWHPDSDDIDQFGFQRSPHDWNGIRADCIVRDPGRSCGDSGQWRHTESASDIIGYCARPS